MSLGTQPTKADVDAMLTDITRSLNIAFDRIRNAEVWELAQLDAFFTGLGYSSNDITTLRTIIRDLDSLRQVYEGTSVVVAGGAPGDGTVQVGNGRDFRAFAKQAWEFGF
jgi:hypothetical protein